jgi:hypothetical protein
MTHVLPNSSSHVYYTTIMQSSLIAAIKSNILRISVAILGLAAASVLGSPQAHAQVAPTTCPSATVYYSNGYSLNNCVPSYYPGYPQTTVYVGGNPYNTGNYNGGYGFNGGNGYSTTQYNPFTPPVTNNNALNLFAPSQTITAPTWYYPPVQNNGYTYTNYPVGGYSGNAFYNPNPGYNNGGYYGGGYGNGGYNNGGYNNGGYNNGGYNNGYYYGNNGWH